MGTAFKSPVRAATVPTLRRVARLAHEPGFAEASRWFVRMRSWITEQHVQLCRIAAPTFFERNRAEWFRVQLERYGWEARVDRAGNVAAVLGSPNTRRPLVMSAHLDTVLAPSRLEEVYVAGDGRIVGPGTADNGAGLTALLVLARLLTSEPELRHIAENVLLLANVGEEGEGNLSGMRHFCQHSGAVGESTTFLVLDGPSTDHITAQALASRRFEVTFSGPGGHSWNDHGVPNPVHVLSEVVTAFLRGAEDRLAEYPKTACSYNFGIFEGGNSINAIPSSARAKLDIRSEDTSLLDELARWLTAIVERTLEQGNRAARNGRLTAKIREVGSRPGGALKAEAPLLGTVQAVDNYLKIRSKIDCASTDANVPLSMGIAAVSIGAGGSGGGAHTHAEWYQPEGRELGLQRILLTLGLLCETVLPASE